jgi:hypothetical protein
MKANHEAIKAKALANQKALASHETHDMSPLVFGLAMAAVFAAMLILNAIFY